MIRVARSGFKVSEATGPRLAQALVVMPAASGVPVRVRRLGGWPMRTNSGCVDAVLAMA